MIYENTNCKKMKGSYLLSISCGSCKTNLLKYQKVGKGNILKLHIDRIIEGFIDFSKESPRELKCINCGEKLGTKVNLKKSNKYVYKMVRGKINTKSLV